MQTIKVNLLIETEEVVQRTKTNSNIHFIDSALYFTKKKNKTKFRSHLFFIINKLFLSFVSSFFKKKIIFRIRITPKYSRLIFYRLSSIIYRHNKK